jgi:cell division protein FtsQ
VYSFPVLAGTSDNEPLSTRAARMRIYNTLVRDLDSDGSHYSKDLSEVDLSDPDDAKVTVADPAGAVLLHLGSSNFLERYKIYIAHAEEWRAQSQKLESVDLRFDRQIIVNPDTQAAPPAPVAAAPAPKPKPKPKGHGKRAAKPSHRH